MTDDFDTVHRTVIDGYTMAYRQNGSGSPIVLLHGIPTHSLLWRKVQRELAAEHEVFAPDLIGYGHSDKAADADPSVSNQAHWIAAFLRERSIGPVVLVGHDIGGGIAQLVAAHQPDLVERLVLVDTIAYDSWPEPSTARLKDPSWDRRFDTIDLVTGFQRGLQRGMVHADLATEQLASTYAGPFIAAGTDSYLRVARALRTEDLVNETEAIEAIGIPTTVVWGAQDAYQHIDYGRHLVAKLQNAQLVVLDGVGHFVPEEAPTRLARLISAGAGS